jgi:hypothetical protein
VQGGTSETGETFPLPRSFFCRCEHGTKDLIAILEIVRSVSIGERGVEQNVEFSPELGIGNAMLVRKGVRDPLLRHGRS